MSIPILPQWTVNLAVPIEGLMLPAASVPVPPNISVPVSGTPSVQTITGTVKTVLEKIQTLGITDIRLEIEVRKPASPQLALTDTLVLGPDAASLATSVHRYGFAMAATDTMVADTFSLSAATVQLLQALGQNGGTLATQVRGVVATGGGVATVLPANVVSVSGHLIVAVPMGGK
jgi:hypothetical protein